MSLYKLYSKEISMADTIIAMKENSKTVSYFLEFFFFLPYLAYVRVLALYYTNCIRQIDIYFPLTLK